MRAVIGASLTVESGEIVGLVGESGCGKSTLGRAAVGLVAPSAGQVRYRGQPVPAAGRGCPAIAGCGRSRWSSRIPTRRSTRGAGSGARSLTPSGSGPGPRSTTRRRPLEWAHCSSGWGCPPAIAHRYPHEFSGGQCQRIAIARVLATEPSCVVADEPISSLDASAQAQVANLLAGIVAESGLGMLFISHDLSVVRKIADRTVVMYFGRIVESGRHRAHLGRTGAPVHPGPDRRHPGTRGRIRLALRATRGRAGPGPASSGCRFHPRCPEAMDRCRTEDPPAVEVEPGWQSLCLRSEPHRAADRTEVK